jgi:carbamoyltransferase
MHENSKDILNRMKGRQSWRPVAPIVTAESFSDFFEGPVPSPYMNLVHRVKTQHRDTLVSLAHPDGSARVQTLERDEDPFLHDVLGEFGRLTGYPILVNTSFNGPGQPILESPEDALDFLLRAEELDGILLEQELVRRDNEPLLRRYGLADEVIVTRIGPRSARRVILIREGLALEVPQDVFELMDSAALSVDEALDDNVRMILIRAARQGFLVRREDRS